MSGKRVMIFAGEASGDLQGAMLVRELKKIDSSLEFMGIGGVRMKKEGVDIYLDSTPLGVVGAWEGIKGLPRFLRIYRDCKEYFLKNRPDMVVFIDTPAFNMRLAKISKREGIKSVYYFPPSAWSGSVKRARQVGSLVDKVVNVFRFTAKTYDRAGVPYFYTGHPLVDFIHPWKVAKREDILRDLGLPSGKRFVSLLPGSRVQEICRILPLLTDVASLLYKRHRDLHFLVPIASPLLKEKVLGGFKEKDFPVSFFDGKSPAVMSVSSLVIMASGSAALEAALLEKPMIVTYRINELDYFLIKTFLDIKWVSLPNLMLQRYVVPELIQEKAKVENILKWAEDLLEDAPIRRKMVESLKELNHQVGEVGVVSRIAKHLWETVL